jgi:hypothetical protein
VTIYGPSTDVTQAGASRRMAANLAAKRHKRSFIRGKWFEDNKLIGYGPNEEDGLTSRVKPRSLRQRGLS